jgi:hypothetical protein
MVALSARRLVWLAMLVISRTTSPIRVDEVDSASMSRVVWLAWPEAFRVSSMKPRVRALA